MSLQVWLPLNGNINNQGLMNVTPILMGTGVTYTAGKIGNAAQFPNNCNSCIHMPGLNLQTGTFAAWIKVIGQGATSRQCIVSEGRDSYSDGVEIFANQAGTTLYFKAHTKTLSTTIALNTWYHVCGTFGDNVIKMYLNGVQVATSDYTGEMTYEYSNNRLVLGKMSYSYTSTANYFSYNGQLNDVRIYDHALSAKEVKELSKGLVLHYKLDGKDETTTNLITTEDGLSNTAYNGSINKYGYNADSNMQKVVGDFNGRRCTKVSMITEGVAARPYVYFSNIFVSNGTNQPEYKTLSFDYYGTIGTYVNFYKLGSGSGTGAWKNTTLGQSGNWTNSGNIIVEPNKWNHIELTLHGTTDANAEFGYCILGDTHTTAASNYWLFANVQVETKDHATPYVGAGGSRTYNVEYDCSGYGNNGTVTNAPISSTSGGRYNRCLHIGATNQKISVSGLTTSGFGNSYSFSWWAKPNTWSSKMHWGFADGIRLNGIYNGTLWNTGDGSNNPLYSPGTTTQVTAPDTNWHHWVMTGNGTKCYVYKDGVLWAEAKTYKAISGTNIYINGWNSATDYSMDNLDISDFRIYATALSADDVLELYHTSASIDNHGNVHAYELEEV